MNSNDFIYTFSTIFGYSYNKNNNFNIKQNILAEEILLNQKIDINESNIIDIDSSNNNYFFEKTKVKQLSNNSNYNNNFLSNTEYIRFSEEHNIYKLDIDYSTIFKKFEETFNSVINCLSNIIYEMRKFKISVYKDKKEFIQLINNKKNELNYKINNLLMFQDIYSNEISNMIIININKANKNYISKVNEIIFIKEEIHEIFKEYFYNIYSVIEVLNIYSQELMFI